uniref:Uncharacterized protein n=1 Tax=Parascaris equorum TaxID=6256 RepID=A0A914R8M2_PAREQ
MKIRLFKRKLKILKKTINIELNLSHQIASLTSTHCIHR